MDIAGIREVVYEIVRDILTEKGTGPRAIVDGDRLGEELGLRSLELARLVAQLEERFGVDPFETLVSITSVRTVGDVCEAYRAVLAGERDTAGLDDARRRALRRLGAAGRREG